ncbi:MAG: N-6 DNA methylase [Deltaproteobacteria bacterium]|nr:N-6 DNA methylase [Deltaproteobacteria bacterium]
MTEEQFADMCAQTICYGLFAARCNSGTTHFTREEAAYLLPRTNPFLRRMFGHIAGPELDDRIAWVVDDLALLLARADVQAIVSDFGRRSGREDPVVHFYETFLAAYDPRMREARGVYYTPEPVVSYIVRSVDLILRRSFGLDDGLASSEKMAARVGGRQKDVHRVLILDPAVGTGTFLFGVIDLVHQRFWDRKGDLHGNSKKKECAPDGGKEENVFDIRQGVAIGIFVRRSSGRRKVAEVRHAGGGRREGGEAAPHGHRGGGARAIQAVLAKPVAVRQGEAGTGRRKLARRGGSDPLPTVRRALDRVRPERRRPPAGTRDAARSGGRQPGPGNFALH